jgi:hypothetical protein
MFYVSENYWLSRLPLPSAGIIQRSGSCNIEYLFEYSEVGGIQYGVRPTLALSSR